MPNCKLCGNPMPVGEEMFRYHGYSGSCPKPPLKNRQYKFKVGDKVNFIEEDEYTGCGMGGRHRAQHGAGPYEIEATEEVTDHAQFVYVNGECYSGWWFKPVAAHK